MVPLVRQPAVLLQNRASSQLEACFYLLPTMTSLVFPQDSQAVGLIILERCQVEADNESGNRNAFKLGKAAMAACLASNKPSLLVSV